MGPFLRRDWSLIYVLYWSSTRVFSTLQYWDLCTVHHLPRSLDFGACFHLWFRSRLPPSEALTALPLESGFFGSFQAIVKQALSLLCVGNKTRSQAQVVPLMGSRSTYSQVNIGMWAVCQWNFIKPEYWNGAKQGSNRMLLIILDYLLHRVSFFICWESLMFNLSFRTNCLTSSFNSRHASVSKVLPRHFNTESLWITAKWSLTYLITKKYFIWKCTE